jgi:hypothetical protein
MSSEMDFLTSIRQQSVEAAVEVLAGIQRAKDARGYAQARLLFGLARLQMEQLKLLLQFNRTSSAMIVDRVRETIGMVSPKPPAAPARELVFRGKLGDRVTRRFIVDNTSSATAAPSFAISMARSKGGAGIYLRDVEITADLKELTPEGQCVVTITIPLSERDLRPGETYIAEIHARVESWIVMTAPVRVEVSQGGGEHGVK